MLKGKKARWLLSSLSLVAVLALFFSACGAQGTPTSQTADNSKPVKGGTWIDDLPNEPGSLIPNGDAQTFSVLVQNALYAPPFYGDTKGNITPGIVSPLPTLQNGGISADFKTWKFTMLPNLKWSDGQPLNADDMDFTWRLWVNPKFAAYSTDGYNQITSTDISADKLTITFHLKQAYAPFLAAWTDGGGAPLPKHIFEKMAPESILKSKENLNPSVVSGPFKMSESVPGNHYTVVRNDNYFLASQGMPYLDKVIFRPVANQNTVLKDLQANNATSTWFIDVSKTKAYQALTNYNFVVNPAASNFETIVINFKNPILGNNLEVRQALAMAIDHNALIKTARVGQASPLCTDHGAGIHPGYQPDAPCPKFDPAAANKLLDDHGWVKGADGVRAKNGQRLEFKYSTTSGKPWRLSDEEILQQNFKDIGIKINVNNVPASTFFGTFLNSGQHDLAEFESSFTYDPNDSSLLACDQIPPPGGQGGNWTFHCDQELDKLIKQQQQTADPAARQAIFNKEHEILLTQFPYIILYSPTDPGIARKTTHNYLPGPEGAQESVNIWKWWCDGGKC
ncbi:MAG: peptide ABC transporter substrate-binding protein [Ktedonobacteraceae bacterium]